MTVQEAYIAGAVSGILFCWAMAFIWSALNYTQRKSIVLHPVTMKLKPFPTWDRFRIAAACLLFGEFSFSGEISDMQTKK